MRLQYGIFKTFKNITQLKQRTEPCNSRIEADPLLNIHEAATSAEVHLVSAQSWCVLWNHSIVFFVFCFFYVEFVQQCLKQPSKVAVGSCPNVPAESVNTQPSWYARWWRWDPLPSVLWIGRPSPPPGFLPFERRSRRPRGRSLARPGLTGSAGRRFCPGPRTGLWVTAGWRPCLRWPPGSWRTAGQIARRRFPPRQSRASENGP